MLPGEKLITRVFLRQEVEERLKAEKEAEHG
jgi:hypothetical protein